MSFTNVLTLFGGLALFLFGMDIMGQALEKKAGGKMKSILAQLTSTPLKGMLLGAGVTAIIQSSSATTVMVVGFVNSGIMTLRQAIGVIMGANIGTTVTAWILSLTGISGDSFWVSLLKPSSFTPVLAVIGIVFLMFLKDTKKNDTGLALLGFAVLMFGMETMSSAVAPLADVPEFSEMLLLFSNPVLGVLAGTLLTAIIQSSSASVGILQALSATGAVSCGTAIPIIMGQNIGTCVTALLSSVGTTRNAKRAAMVHLYFNIIGTVVLLIAFYGLNAAFQFSFITQSANQLSIALIHTLFNVMCVALMFPFVGALEKLACMTVHDNPEPERPELLDERLLSAPTIAVVRCNTLAGELAQVSREDLHLALSLLKKYDETTEQQVKDLETKSDFYEDRLGSYLVVLSQKGLNESNARDVFKQLHTIGDYECICDYAVNIQKSAKEMYDKQITFSPQAVEELRIIIDAVKTIVDLTIDAYLFDNLENARKIEPLKQAIDSLRAQMRGRHIMRLQNGICTIELGFVFSDLLTAFERVADHCSNIAACLIEVTYESFDMHAYLDGVRLDENQEFGKLFLAFKEQYCLPHQTGDNNNVNINYSSVENEVSKVNVEFCSR